MRSATAFGRIGALFVVPSLLLVALASGAQARSGPEDGSTFTDRRTHTGPDGARSSTTVGCTGPDGEAYQRQETRTADEDGEKSRTRTSGDPAACADHRSRSSERGQQGPSLVNVSTGEVKILSPERPR